MTTNSIKEDKGLASAIEYVWPGDTVSIEVFNILDNSNIDSLLTFLEDQINKHEIKWCKSIAYIKNIWIILIKIKDNDEYVKDIINKLRNGDKKITGIFSEIEDIMPSAFDDLNCRYEELTLKNETNESVFVDLKINNPQELTLDTVYEDTELDVENIKNWDDEHPVKWDDKEGEKILTKLLK